VKIRNVNRIVIKIASHCTYFPKKIASTYRIDTQKIASAIASLN